MYKVYSDDVLVYDPRSDDLDFINPVLNLALNDAGQFTFTVPPNHPRKDALKPLTSTIRVYRDGIEQPLFIGRIVFPEGDFNNSTTITCEGALSFLNDSLQPPAEYHDISPMGYVGVLLEQHNQQVEESRQIKLGAVTVTDPNDKLYRYTNDNSTLQELKEDIIDDLGGYCRIREEDDGLYLDILKDFGVRCEQTIELGTNLMDFQKNTDYTEMVTVIKPKGAKVEELNEGEIENNENDVLDKRVTIEEVNDGHDYLVNEELRDKYGPIWRTVIWDDVHTPERLKKKAEEWMMDQDFESLVIDAKAFDFSFLDDGIESFHLGDEIRVISKPHNLDRWFLLSQMEIHLDSLSENTITLGGKGRPITLSGITTQLTVSTSDLDDKQVVPNKLIEQAINQATQLITSMTHGYVVVEPDQILIMDTDDPETAKMVWRWTMGGLGFSNNGINGPFETAITMDGTIVGKFIAANSIAAEQLDVNYRTKVETQITEAEEGANDYTDSKLKSYWTTKEIETYFKTESDKIVAGVNTTLSNNYSTTREIQSMLSITEGNIQTYVGDTLKSYSTTTAVQSMIDQKAGEITTTVSQIEKDVDGLETSMRSVEQKVTPDGIFTTINNGIAGSERIYNTKFEMTRSGLTVQGGGITIKNNAGTSVFYADTSGNLTMRGTFVQYSSSNRKSVEIADNEYKVYAWNYDGNYVGGLGSPRDSDNRDYPVGLWCDWGDDLVIGYRSSSGSSEMTPVIRLGAKQSGDTALDGSHYGIKYIRGSWSGVHRGAGNALHVSQGIVIGEDTINEIRSHSYELPGGGRLAFTNGVLSGFTEMTATLGHGNIWIGQGHLDFTNGIFTGYTALGGISRVVDIGGGGNLSVTNGLIVGATNSFLVSSNGQYLDDIVYLGGGGNIRFSHGIAQSATNSVNNGITADMRDSSNWVWHFTNGLLTGYDRP